ncbi:MAG: hypothetical protein U0174_28310 [Polyangiaceae bacterium]
MTPRRRPIRLRPPFELTFAFVVALVTLLFAALGAGCSDGVRGPLGVNSGGTIDAAPAPFFPPPTPDAGTSADASDDAAADANSNSFNVLEAVSTSPTKVVVTFDAPPTASEATDPTHYDIGGLTLSAPTLAGNSVTLTTTTQSSGSYALTVTGVTRAKDSAPLDTATAAFDGRAPFAVTSATATDAATVLVTFDAPPTTAQATTLANYSIVGLTLIGVPTLSGNTVKLHTSAQLGQSYTLTISNVTRAGDSEPLGTKVVMFAGIAAHVPTVTSVIVDSTSPNNGTTPYNTGTTTVTLGGTDFSTVDCISAQKGVRLDDKDGVDVLAGTRATSCTILSDTELTVTFPAGIRTNGAAGWNVIVTNPVGSNATSDLPFTPVAGLLISEVYTGSGGAADHEFIELYNPTGAPIDTKAAGIGLKLHVRTSAGVDTAKTLTPVTSGIIPSHGFLLLASSVSDAGDPWFAHRDYTFPAALVANGGVYISLSTTENAKVIDKVGWGTQAAFGFETTAAPSIGSDESIERRPAGGNGHTVDSDSNADDFTDPSTTITPRGIADGPEP